MDKKLQSLFVVVLTFVIAVCWKSDFVRFLLGFEILLFLLLYIEIRYLYKKLDVQLKLPETVVYREEHFPVQVQATNLSFIPIAKMRVQVMLYDRWADRELGASGVFMLDGKETGTLQLSFSPAYCGVYEIRISSYRIWDHLGLYSKLKRLNLHERVLYVLPSEATTSLIDASVGHQESEGDQAEFREGRSSVDTSDIREYRVGDDLRHIHWKLSAKSLDIMVREMGEPLENMNQVYLNLQYSQEKLTREEWEKFLSSVALFSSKLINAGHSHTVYWIDIVVKKMIEYRVTDAANLQEMLCGLLHASPWHEGEVSEILEEIRWNETMEEVIEISIQGEIISSGFTR